MHNNQIIQKIKDENLKPISKSVFLLKKIIVWFLLASSTVFGAYAFAFFFLKILFVDFDHWYFLANSYDRFLIENIPIIWIVLFTFSLVCISLLFKRTNRGYRHSVLFIAIISVIISFILGIILSKVFANRGVLIERFETEKLMLWTNPNSGRVSGEVLFAEDDYVLLRDINDDIWNINTVYILDDSRQVLNNDQLISVIGRLDYDNNFTACQIIPFDIDKNRFRPNIGKRGFDFRQKNIENRLTKEICDFVINTR